MTISDTTPHKWVSALRTRVAEPDRAPWASAVENSLEVRLSAEHPPTEAIRRVRSFVETFLPALLPGRPEMQETVLAVLTELVDITARHQHCPDLEGRISTDGAHVMLTLGEMDRPLPSPDEEPGLYLVHRLVDDIGQYRGDQGGHATWASVPLKPEA
ncbi:ATP-binding protein [Streptomyces boncukensis]|uniref:ATP-binding protein n=1 Tax=Streptomyces boncukensis TaxID=2711219 RepID=A0A6G4WPQ4_9ACTN|nr:ATP-binding protein [Streptomyces boncukensis]NGO66993.1 ATP-binding protein [Streptomyces boncukensis]